MLKNFLTILVAGGACFAILLLWPAPHSAHLDTSMVAE